MVTRILSLTSLSLVLVHAVFATGQAPTTDVPLITNNQIKVMFTRTDDNAWQSAKVYDFINRNTYITSSARSIANPSLMAVGTSFEGIYESRDAGATWSFISDSKIFKQLFQGASFFDEVDALAYADDGTEDLFFRIGFGGGSFRYVRKSQKVVPADFSFPDSQPAPIAGMENPVLPEAGRNSPLERAARQALATNKKAIFLNASHASGVKLDRQIAFAKRNGINAFVVDFKDDTGTITYDSALDLVRETKAAKPRFKAAELIKKAHENGIYLIARIVVFKDPMLYAYKSNAYALWDKATKKPWGVWRDGVQIESWVDPYADPVHQYNISIASELEGLGVDEIQFDYIRFPSDGLVKNIQARFHVGQDGGVSGTETPQDRIHALSTFLSKARSALSVPISTDVFGFNGWARMSYLGQDIQAFARYVDVISPMAYPSHYARDFLPGITYFERAGKIQLDGTRRARSIVQDSVLIRPYLQAFLIGNERKFTDPQFFDYLNRQVTGARQGGASGFALWNQSGTYYMVNEKTFKTTAGE